MKNVIRISALMAAAVAVFCAACGKKQSQPASETKPAATTPANTEQKSSTPAAPAPAAKQDAAPTQETAEGTLALFVQALKDGDYSVASELADPTSIGAISLKDLAEAMEKLAVSDNSEQKNAEQLIKSMYTKPWQDVKTQLSSVREDRSRYTFTFANNRSIDVDVIQTDGLWRVFVPEVLLDIGLQPNLTLEEAKQGEAGSEEEGADEGADEGEEG